MSYNHAESPYWIFGSNIRVGWIKFQKGKGWSASLRLGDRAFLTEKVYPDMTFTLPKLRVKLAEDYGVVVPMKDKLHLVSTRGEEKMYVI